MKWTKYNELYDRIYTATGQRGSYRIDLDMPADRFAIHLNGSRMVENVYYIYDAKRIAEHFDFTGLSSIPDGLRGDPSGGHPRFVGDPPTSALPPVIVDRPAGRPLVAPRHSRPAPRDVAMRIVDEVRRLDLKIDDSSVVWSPWDSGLYCLLDCVFSAQARYEAIVVPMLKRLQLRANMDDLPDRKFSDFVADVDSMGQDASELYAANVLNRQRVGGRLKVAVAYDCAKFFADGRCETMSDLHAVGDALPRVVLSELRRRVSGIGPALSHYLLSLLGYEDHVKLDSRLLGFWSRLDDNALDPFRESDYALALETFRIAACELNTTPARLDKAIWEFESGTSAATR